MSARKILQTVAIIAAAAFAPGINAQTISTYAGGGKFTDAPGLNVATQIPQGIAVAADGTVYFCAGNSVYHLKPASGTVTLVAGNGSYGYSGDGGPATSAQLQGPTDVTVDSAGNLYIADPNDFLVRRVDATTGIISRFAGSFPGGYGGDGGPATAAQLLYPAGVALDGAGNLYIADTNDEVIRRVDAATGTITTVAGNGTTGFSGDGGPATAAQLAEPYGVAVDGSGDIYIADTSNNVIRRVDATTGVIMTAAGNGAAGYSGDGGPAVAAQLQHPHSVSIDSAGNLYIADTNNNVIRRVDSANATISTVAGDGSVGYGGDGGPATSAQIFGPYDVAVDAASNLYISDSTNEYIRRVDGASGTITTLAGNGTFSYGGDGGTRTAAQLYFPLASAFDAAGNLFILDSGNQVVRRVDAATATISTIAGTGGSQGYSGDGGAATSAQLFNPAGIALDAAGNVYIADSFNQVIRRVAATTELITTYAGSHTRGYSGDGGPATAAQFFYPRGLAVDSGGNLFIADSDNSVIRRVDAANGTISTFAGNGTRAYSGDGGPATAAQLNIPYGVACDAADNVYIADSVNQVVRRVDAVTGTISTVAGNNTIGYSGDGGAATSAQLSQPSDIALDAAGNLYIADINNQVIRRVDASSQQISTVAGDHTFGFSGDGGAATNAQLANPASVTLDAGGNLYIADSSNDRIRVVSAGANSSFTVSPRSLNFGNEPPGSTSAAMDVTVTNTGNVDLPLSITLAGQNPRQFAQTNTCDASLTVGSSCTLSVVFKPTVRGSLQATLTIAAGSAGTQSVTLSGTGGSASFTVSPRSLGFGNQPIGFTSAAHTVTVRNTGSTTVAVASISLGGQNPHQFSQTNDCGTTLNVGATCTISVTFKPIARGLQKARLNINGGAAGTQTVALRGTGVTPA